MVTTVVETNREQLLQKAAWHLCERIGRLLAGQEQVNLAVPGGRNVAEIFQIMREERLDWRRVHFFIVDERLVPIDHPDSNFALLREHLIAPLEQDGRIDPANAHPFIFDPIAVGRGTQDYERVLAEHGFRYDVILLSSGEDGHVGALYPGHHSIADHHHGFIVMGDSPKPPPERMTSSLSLMQTAAVAVLLFVGEAKRDAYRRFRDPACPVAFCPARLVLDLGDAAVFTDLE